MYNVTLRRVRAAIAARKKQKVFHIPRVSVCDMRYPVWYAHVLYPYDYYT